MSLIPEININQEPENNISKFKKYDEECFVDVSVEVAFPKIILSIGEHEYKGKIYDNATMTKGEITVIKAKKKSKKTFFKSAIEACYIGGKANYYFPSIKSKREVDNYILSFDTEQDVFYSSRAFRRVMEMVGSNYDFYEPYGIKKIPKSERLDYIGYKVNQLLNQDKIIDLLVIDHIADLVRNFNDIVESDKAIQKILEWSSKGINILAVIHANPNDPKARGHLGTEIENKAETIISVERTDYEVFNDPVKVSNLDARGVQFDDFYFKVNTDALPYECSNDEIDHIKKEEKWK